jgi:hypothetical protein
VTWLSVCVCVCMCVCDVDKIELLTSQCNKIEFYWTHDPIWSMIQSFSYWRKLV